MAGDSISKKYKYSLRKLFIQALLLRVSKNCNLTLLTCPFLINSPTSCSIFQSSSFHRPSSLILRPWLASSRPSTAIKRRHSAKATFYQVRKLVWYSASVYSQSLRRSTDLLQMNLLRSFSSLSKQSREQVDSLSEEPFLLRSWLAMRVQACCICKIIQKSTAAIIVIIYLQDWPIHSPYSQAEGLPVVRFVCLQLNWLNSIRYLRMLRMEGFQMEVAVDEMVQAEEFAAVEQFDQEVMEERVLDQMEYGQMIQQEEIVENLAEQQVVQDLVYDNYAAREAEVVREEVRQQQYAEEEVIEAEVIDAEVVNYEERRLIEQQEYEQRRRAEEYEQRRRADEYQQRMRVQEYEQRRRAEEFQQMRIAQFQQKRREQEREYREIQEQRQEVFLASNEVRQFEEVNRFQNIQSTLSPQIQEPFKESADVNSMGKFESPIYYHHFFEWKEGVGSLTNGEVMIGDKAVRLSDLGKIKVTKQLALNNSRKTKLSHLTGDVLFSVESERTLSGLPLHYMWLARVVTEKLCLKGCDLDNPYVPERRFTNSHIKSPLIDGILYKQSQYLKTWELRYVAITPEGLFSYKDEAGNESFTIKRDTATELWTRFDIHEKMLVIKVHHSSRKTEFGIPIVDFCRESEINWLFAFYRLLFPL